MTLNKSMFTPIIFLDIDGVLYPDTTKTWFRLKHMPFEGAFAISPKKVSLLNGLIAATDAEVVLTTMWDLPGNRVATMQKMFEDAGFTGKIIGETPEVPGTARSFEIVGWFYGNPNRRGRCVVFDDSSDAWESKGPFNDLVLFIQTGYKEGLTAMAAKRAYDWFINAKGPATPVTTLPFTPYVPPQPTIKYPEHDKLDKIQEDSRVIGEFLNWLSAQDAPIGQYEKSDFGRFRPSILSNEQWLLRYFQINSETLEAEKKGMLAEIRAANNNPIPEIHIR